MRDPSTVTPEQDEPYVVTRGKPPREYQFKPGQSGNPKGRPKGSKELRTLLEKELEDKVDATIAGQNVRLTKRKAMVKRLVDKAIQGDLKALLTIVRLEEQGGTAPPCAAADSGSAEPCPAKDAEIIQAYIARAATGDGDDPPA